MAVRFGPRRKQLAFNGLEPLEPRLLLAGDFSLSVGIVFPEVNNTSPGLFGTSDNEGAIVEVRIDGGVYIASRDTIHTWELPSGIIDALSEGTYDIDLYAYNPETGESATYSAADALTIDLTPPALTIDPLNTADTTPQLTGTITDENTIHSVQVFIEGEILNATVTGNTWTLAGEAFDDIGLALDQRVYDVTVRGYDSAGNTGQDTSTNELHIDLPLTVAVTPLTTNVASPRLFGTVNDRTATVTVHVNGADYTAINHGDGTWSLNSGTLAALGAGTYEVTVAAEADGDVANDTTTNDLVIDPTAAAVAIDPAVLDQETGTFQLTGTVADTDATVQVQLQYDLVKYSAFVTADGVWRIATGLIPQQLDGQYDILVQATSADGSVAQQFLAEGLTVDLVPQVAVDSLTTDEPSPELTGLVDDPTAVIEVTVNGQTYQATNNGDAVRDGAGTWVLPAGTLAPLSGGVYDVAVTATDTGGKVGTTAGTGALTIGLTITMDTQLTNDNRPELTGTVNDPDAAVTITIGGNSYAATNSNGVWTLADDAIPAIQALEDGLHSIPITATNAATGLDGQVTAPLLVDTGMPTVVVLENTTTNRSPGLSGTASDVGTGLAEITVTVAGQTFTLSDDDLIYNNDTFSWFLPSGTLAELAPGTYNVLATATDEAGNTGNDTSTNELTIEFDVTVNTLTSGDRSPELTGTVAPPADVTELTVEVDGQTFTLGDDEVTLDLATGVWTLPAGMLDPLDDGTYDVTVSATVGGAIISDTSTDELTINTAVPAITVDPLTTNDSTPEVTGTVEDPDAYIELTIAGQTFNSDEHISVSADGTWRLLGDSWTTPLGVGTYDVVATADLNGSVGTDETVDELVVTNRPLVDTLVTNDTTPAVTGTVWDAANVTEIRVTVDGQTFSLAGGDVTLDVPTGAWILLDNALAVLDDGVYDVAVTATNNGQQFTDASTDELTIDTAGPIVTVDPLITTYMQPRLSGTVTDPESIVELTVQIGSGTVFTLDTGVELDRTTGVWVLPQGIVDPQIASALPLNVNATATDDAGNVATDPTAGELDVRSQEVVDIGGALRVVEYIDPDGTRVRIRIKRGGLQHSLSLYFDSNSVITSDLAIGQLRAKTKLKAEAGLSLDLMAITGDTTQVAISTGGGRVRGTTIGRIIGGAQVDGLKGKGVHLGNGVNPAIAMTTGIIQNISLASLTGDVIMGGVARRGVAFNIAGEVTDSNIEVRAADVRAFQAGRMVNSSLMVGVVGPADENADGVYDLAELPQLNPHYELGSFSLRGLRGSDEPSLVNSNIAAYAIKSGSINGAQLDNDGEAFGVTADELSKLQLLHEGTKVIYPKSWDGTVNLLDFTLRLGQA